MLLFNFISFSVYSQSSTCAGALPFCASGSTYTFPNVTGIPSSGSPGCLGSTPNPAVWFSFQIAQSGNLNFLLTQGNNAPNYNNLDVDFICWGPFPAPQCAGLYDFPDGNTSIPNNIVACSYSPSAVENFSIPGAVAGQVYMIMITNFSNLPGQITLTQTNIGQPGAGTTDCNILCPLAINGGGTFCPATPATLITTINGLSTPAAYAGATFTWTSTAPGFIPPPTNVGIITVTVPGTYTVVVNKPGCVSGNSASATYNVAPVPNTGTPNNLTICNPNSAFNLNLNTPVIQNGNSGIIVDYHTNQISANDGAAGGSIIPNPSNYVGTNGQTIYVSMEDSFFGCIYTTSFQLNIVPSEVPVLSASVVNETVTITAVGNGIYQYSIDNGSYQNSPVFNNVTFGSHIVTVISTNGCGTASINVEVVTPPAPLAVSPQYFNTGWTLQNLIANGQNIQWYANASGKNSSQQTMSVPLPLSTPLVDGTTYHVSQTVNGVESINRTPVLALLALATVDFSFANLNYFPNPVKNSFTISNSLIIDDIEIISILGQKIMTKKVNDLETEIDLSTLSSGIYILKVSCEGNKKTVKIIKE